MGSKHVRIGAAAAVAATIGLAGIAGTSGTAGAAEQIPPISCGLVRHEVGPLSSLVHRLEPAVLGLGLAYPLHDLNCSVVIELEYATGLQTRPRGPFG